MKICIEIRTDNAAFEDNLAGEVSDMLHELSMRIQNLGSEDLPDAHFTLNDSNGNSVGKLVVTE